MLVSGMEHASESMTSRAPDRTRALLDAVLAVTADVSSVEDVLDRIVARGRALVGARHATLCVVTSTGEAVETAVGEDEAANLQGHGRVAIPIHVAGRLFGHLSLTGKDVFTRDDREDLATLAVAAGVAIDNARRYDRAHRREQWLRATTEVTAVLRTEEADGFDLLVRRAREIPNAVLSVLAVPLNAEHLVLSAVDGKLAHELTGVPMSVVDSLTGDVFSTGRPRMVTAVAEATFTRSATTFGQLPGGLEKFGPAVFVPLSTGRHPIGVLIVAKACDAEPFDDDDLDMIAGYAGHAALAIEFARAQQDRQRLALFEERDRIARDLHDLVIQRLFALGLGLQGATRVVGQEASERLRGWVLEIDHTIREIRRSIFSLQEPESGPYSLRGEILRAISDATMSLGYEPTVRLEGPLDSVVPSEIQFDLIATLREALSNVVRHADACGVQVTVAVDRRATRLDLLVQDDGRGLPDGITQRSGLANMVQRAERHEGTCAIGGVDPGGTLVDWMVPLPCGTSSTGERR